MSEFILFNAPQSTCSQRVRYLLHAKGITFEEHKLDLFAGDQLKAEYLAINPNGVVPTLVHDGQAIIDSAVILEYLEDILPDSPSFRPDDPVAVAEMRSQMRFIDEVPTPAIRVPSYNLAFLPHFQTMSETEFQELCDSKPLRREFLMKMGRTGFPTRTWMKPLVVFKGGLTGWHNISRKVVGPGCTEIPYLSQTLRSCRLWFAWMISIWVIYGTSIPQSTYGLN